MIWLAAALAQLLGGDLPPAPVPPGPFQQLASGLYETLAPDTGLPAGPLAAPPTGVLTEWLEVTVSGRDHLAIVFQPDGRVRWLMRVGPDGPIAKTTFVDAAELVTSTFTYDHHCPLEKRVSGPGLPEGFVQRYRCDAAGRIVARGDDERIERTPGTPGYLVRHLPGDHTTGWTERRLGDGRLAAAWTGADERTAVAAFAIERDAHGAPTGLVRQLGGTRLPVPRGNPVDERVSADALAAIRGGMGRGLIHALLGAPRTTSDDGDGLQRAVSDDWSNGCWLNRVSMLAYDPSLMMIGGHAGCICGLCVADDVPLAGEGILGLDTHVRSGPWVALDGVVVTADHPVLTPVGAVPAGWLHVGSVVMGHDGPRALFSVERLPDGPRRGRNLRTQDGTFEAGGIVFLSEDVTGCPRATP